MNRRQVVEDALPGPPAVEPMHAYYRFARFLSQGALALYFRGRVFGLENVPATGGVLLACNHQSYFDPLAATCALHREGNYMARDSLFASPLFGRLIRSVNAFPVKRGAADTGAIKELLRRLKAGKVVTVFPEATRTRDGSIGRISPNSMAIAKKVRVAIQPTVVDGAFEAWPRTQWLPSPSAIYVSYARPILPAHVAEWSAERLAETVSRRMHRLLDDSRRKRRCAAPENWLRRK